MSIWSDKHYYTDEKNAQIVIALLKAHGIRKVLPILARPISRLLVASKMIRGFRSIHAWMSGIPHIYHLVWRRSCDYSSKCWRVN